MDIKFHLPDFVRHFRLNLTLAEYMSRFPDAFVDGVKIGSVYGCFPNMTWNGGRYAILFDRKKAKRSLQKYESGKS
mgnify:CR=1 FL=1